MIITRTPYRISFFGGGTDYPHWYLKNGGAVLSTTIDRHCYVTCRWLPPFFAHRHRIVWSKIELVEKDADEIQHPTVRSALKFLRIRDGVEIHHQGDLPARTGIGSSSSFTVGLLHALHALKGEIPTKRQLAEEAIHVEQDLNRESVGSQDQTAAAFGGFNHIVFGREGQIEVHPMTLDPERTRELESHLMLFFTGLSRTASTVAAEQIRNAPRKEQELRALQEMVDAAIGILKSGSDLAAFGKLLHEGWELKRSLAAAITTPEVDRIYEAGRAAGAIGGKLIGAGGGGFLLFFVRPPDRPAVLARLEGLLHVPFRFEHTGSEIVFYRPDLWSAHAEKPR